METPDQSQGRVSAAAKTLRILTAPPCMIAWLLVFLCCRGGEPFSDTAAYVVAWIGLVLFPLLGYGVWWLVPRLREQGRPGQRKVAFYANFIGYVGCAVYGWTCSGASVRLFFNSYFFTVLLLTVMNALLHVRASGHAASASSPIVFSWLFAGPAWSIAYMVVFGLSVWSSLVLKRHKKTDILAGVACMLTGFLISLALALDSGWRP